MEQRDAWSILETSKDSSQLSQAVATQEMFPKVMAPGGVQNEMGESGSSPPTRRSLTDGEDTQCIYGTKWEVSVLISAPGPMSFAAGFAHALACSCGL